MSAEQKNEIVICGTRIDNVTMVEAVERIGDLVRARKPSYAITPNVDHLVKLQQDADFRKIYSGASLVLADGVPLLWAAGFLGTPLKEKVSGSDLVPELCEASAKKGHKLFLLGGRPGAADKAKEVLERRYPSIRIVGTCCPPVGFEKNQEESRKIDEAIRTAAPDIVLVGLGAPKQEKWIHQNSQRLEIPVSIGVGVTFEFIANMVQRAPKWMQSVGLEWFWRLVMEPKRLWRRYLVDDPKFFVLVWKQKFSKKPNPSS
jgi:N-acetylglucosaminyldiphosphoundecaprenol N-acetyl-beta-D-mannosaminyltransferase